MFSNRAEFFFRLPQGLLGPDPFGDVDVDAQDAVDAVTIPGAVVWVSDGVYATGGKAIRGAPEASTSGFC